MDLAAPERLHLHLDPLGGIAGDMFVAAMLDAFPQLEKRVMADVAAVIPAGVGTGRVQAGLSCGLAVRRFTFEASSTDHQRHAHDHDHDTTYRGLRLLIESASLAKGTARHAGAILERIARAEAVVHGVHLDDVHFHELADWDSLMDVTAAGSIAAALEGASWSSSALPLGGSTVTTAHGVLPVPAPATVRILQGYRWQDDGVAAERVTPTGAAILAHVTEGVATGRNKGGQLVATGIGAGTRELADRPNILRVTAFEVEGGSGTDRVVQLACDLDDMTGEEIGAAADRLRAMEGVLDLAVLAIQSKKSRPSTRMELLCRPDRETSIGAAMFDLTTTLGLRRTDVQRIVLARSEDAASNGIRRKCSSRPSGRTSKAESDDLNDAPTLAERRRRAREAEEDPQSSVPASRYRDAIKRRSDV